MNDETPRWWITDPDGKLRLTEEPPADPPELSMERPNCRCVVVLREAEVSDAE